MLFMCTVNLTDINHLINLILALTLPERSGSIHVLRITLHCFESTILIQNLLLYVEITRK